MNIKGILAAGMLAALSLGAQAQLFYTVEEQTDTLYTLDIATSTLTPVGSLGYPTQFGDLAFDPSTGTMYLVDGWGNGIGTPSTLYSVDLTTGAATLIGSTGIQSVFALVYDPVTNKLYGACSTIAPYDFVEIDRSTGVGTVIGPNSDGYDGLTYVGSTGEIVGLHAGSGYLSSFDRTTGADTQISPGGGFVNNCGIAWSASNNTIYSIDWSGEVYAFDVSNSYARTNVLNGLGAYDGLAVAGGVAPPTTYCTAGTTTNGCNAAIGATGAASATAGSGFTISVNNLEGQKQGIIFYGINNNGFNPTVWGNGGASFLCVKGPLQRMGVQSSGGTIGGCNGTLSIDWNAYRASHPTALGNPFAVGQLVYAQGWFRDPPAVKTTNLSNGVKFAVGP